MVGKGASATVHRAVCIPLDEVVAIEILDFERNLVSVFSNLIFLSLLFFLRLFFFASPLIFYFFVSQIDVFWV